MAPTTKILRRRSEPGLPVHNFDVVARELSHPHSRDFLLTSFSHLPRTSAALSKFEQSFFLSCVILYNLYVYVTLFIVNMQFPSPSSIKKKLGTFLQRPGGRHSAPPTFAPSESPRRNASEVETTTDSVISSQSVGKVSQSTAVRVCSSWTVTDRAFLDELTGRTEGGGFVAPSARQSAPQPAVPSLAVGRLGTTDYSRGSVGEMATNPTGSPVAGDRPPTARISGGSVGDIETQSDEPSNSTTTRVWSVRIPSLILPADIDGSVFLEFGKSLTMPATIRPTSKISSTSIKDRDSFTPKQFRFSQQLDPADIAAANVAPFSKDIELGPIVEKATPTSDSDSIKNAIVARTEFTMIKYSDDKKVPAIPPKPLWWSVIRHKLISIYHVLFFLCTAGNMSAFIVHGKLSFSRILAHH
jgi:hypothetical protein